MQWFNPDKRYQSERHRRIHAWTELAYTAVDFLAAVFFIIGSALFFREATTHVATWLFLIGSILFGLRPSIRLYREILYLRLGDYRDIVRD